MKPHTNSGHYAVSLQILSENLETIKSAYFVCINLNMELKRSYLRVGKLHNFMSRMLLCLVSMVMSGHVKFTTGYTTRLEKVGQE